MAKIGNFGKTVVFSTSSKKILTFTGLKESVSGRWTTHELIGRKPKSEFLGPGLRSITFDIVLNALHGVKPRKTLKAMELLVEKGRPEKLVVGGKAVGNGRWKMTKISESWDIVMSKGELLQATVSVELEEYV